MNDYTAVDTVKDSTNTLTSKVADQVSKINVPDVKVRKANIEASIGDMEVSLNYDEDAAQPTQVSVTN